MAKFKRHQTKYPGVYFIESKHIATGETEKIYYIRYRRNGKMVEEKAGRQQQDDMTPSRAAKLRGMRIDGDQKSNQESRISEKTELNKMTMIRLWDAFYEAKQENKSVRDDLYRWNSYLEKDFGRKMPQDITTTDIDRLRHRLTKKGLAPATVKQGIVLLKRIINYGMKRGLCPAIDPSRLHFQMPKINNQKTEDLTLKQIECLLKAIEDSPNRQVANLMLMALYTGMRRGELFRLRWENLDFENGFIHLVEPKGGIDQKIPLNSSARQLLENHERTGSPFVFPGRNGGKRTDCKKALITIKKMAGLPEDFRPLHGLRHVYASMLASSGKVDLYTLQKLLTHKDSKMTQRYAHLRDDTLQRAGTVAGDIFKSIERGMISNEEVIDKK
ncbi:MAG: site-specific integrase [Desulfobacteraceae bacterium]|nr:MAG: site-specific integrase [Desulfobacteraceae bacterium]